MGNPGKYNSFGNITTLRPIITPISNGKKPKVPKTRVIRISEQLYRRFQGVSKHYWDVEPYELILSELIDNYEKNNSPYQQYTRY